MEFLELLESIEAEAASPQRLFGGEGDATHSRAKGPAYSSQLLEAARLVERAYSGSRLATLQLQEAMTTSDFPLLFADILDRQLLAKYISVEPTWPAVCVRKEVRDFRDVKRFPRPTGAEATLDPVAENAAYPESEIDEGTPITYHVNKYGRRIPMSLETWTNDDLDALKDVPERFALAARMSEEKFATGLYVGATGPDTTLFTDAHLNIMSVAAGAATANPPLSIAALQDAYKMLGNMVSADGNPIAVTMVSLVVPPALEIVAQNILSATELLLTGTVGGAATDQELRVANWMRNRTRLVVNPWIPIIASSNDHTCWFMFATPAVGAAALEMGFLRGHATPEIFMKAPNARRIGGGEDAFDFDFDSLQYKVRHIFGGVQLDPKLALASTGAAA